MAEGMQYLKRAPSGLKGARTYLFNEHDGKMVARFTVDRHPVVIKAYALAEDQCICIQQRHHTCCGEDVISASLTCCKQHCLTCCDNNLHIATPGDYVILLDEPNEEAIVTITEVKHEQIKYEVSEWL